jgi:hypothetical protein
LIYKGWIKGKQWRHWKTFSRASRPELITLASQNVRYWPKADMSLCTANVCFRG